MFGGTPWRELTPLILDQRYESELSNISMPHPIRQAGAATSREANAVMNAARLQSISDHLDIKTQLKAEIMADKINCTTQEFITLLINDEYMTGDY